MPFEFSPIENGKIEWQTLQRLFSVWRIVVDHNIWNMLSVER